MVQIVQNYHSYIAEVIKANRGIRDNMHLTYLYLDLNLNRYRQGAIESFSIPLCSLILYHTTE